MQADVLRWLLNRTDLAGTAKEMIIKELMQLEAIKHEGELLKPRIIAPPRKIEMKKFIEVMEEHIKSYSTLEESKWIGIAVMFNHVR